MMSPTPLLREYVPLKQGLRQQVHDSVLRTDHPPRVCSTKTRIKTMIRSMSAAVTMPPRVCSTKTRIKTKFIVLNVKCYVTPRVCSTKTRIKTEQLAITDHNAPWLREYVPLKQGLRLFERYFGHDEQLALREYVPLKQGLRL